MTNLPVHQFMIEEEIDLDLDPEVVNERTTYMTQVTYMYMTYIRTGISHRVVHRHGFWSPHFNLKPWHHIVHIEVALMHLR